MIPESVITMPGITDHDPGIGDHVKSESVITIVRNTQPQPLDMIVTMFDTGMQTIVNATVNVPANTSKAFFVDELGTVPPDLFGQVLISPSNNSGPSLYAVGLRFTGLVFTTIPAIVYPRPTAPPSSTPMPPPTTTLSSRTTFGAGTWLVNEEIESGRYFTDRRVVATGSG